MRPGCILDLAMVCVLLAIAYFSHHLWRTLHDPTTDLSANEKLSDEIFLHMPERMRSKVLARQEE